MSTQVQRRKGTTVQHSTFTGASAELTVDTTKNTVVVHNGSTAGGFPLAKETGSAISATSLTLPNGTANAVAFLNGSKVLTSGTALTFDGTNLAVGGTSSARLDVAGWIRSNAATSTPSTGAGVEIGFPATTPWYGATPSGLVQAYDRTASAYLPLGFSGLNFAFAVSGTEQMRLTSTGLGIGTTSPAQKLDVAGNISTTGTLINTVSSGEITKTTGATTGNIYHRITNTGGSTLVGNESSAGGTLMVGSAAYSGIINVTGAYPLAFGTNNTERMRLDSAGNLGLGVTPVNAYTGGKAFDTPSLTLLSVSDVTCNTYFGFNSKFNAAGAPLYRNTGTAAGQYAYENGAFNWKLAPSGTAGAALTFTQAMTLDASGNLLVGTTSNTFSSAKGIIAGSQANGGASVFSIYNSEGTSASDGSPALNLYKNSTTVSSSARFMQFYAGAAGTVPMGGIVGNGSANVQFASISDAREKTNITAINGSLDKVLSLNPVKFDWISNGEHCPAGFVAQDVEQVFPEFVVENVANEGQEARKGLTGGMTGGIVAHLVKAIQEQQALIESLNQRLTAIESK